MTELARIEKARRQTQTAETLGALSLLDFVPRISPRYMRPEHLRPLTERLDAFREKPFRLVVAVPPRHGKTETILHGIAKTIAKHPELTNGYVTYGADLSRSKSRTCRRLAIAAGAQLVDDANRLEEWRTTQGGGLLATGIGGPLTGHGITGILCVDDSIKNRRQAESASEREAQWQWFNDVAYTRLEPGASCLVNMARWHPDDLAGRLIAEGWEYLNLAAIDDDRESLWPERWPVEELEKIHQQIGEYSWASLYQGRPRRRGGSLFHDATLFTERPSEARVAIGVDLAYSSKTHADYSVAVVLAQHGSGDAARWYVLEVIREQCEAPVFVARLKELRTRYPGASCHWYGAGTEKGTADFVRSQGVALVVRAPHGDKFIRAQPVAAAWNRGAVMTPKSAGKWADDFITELCGFTGVNDVHDDQVDALAAAFDALPPGGGFVGKGTGRGSEARRVADV